MPPIWVGGRNIIPFVCIHSLHLRVKVENSNEGDNNGVVNVRTLIGIAIDKVGCVDAIDAKGMGVDRGVEIDG